MASTYSNLKIELIATGEQSGTWGITTNTNLGTALEEAIVGRAEAQFTVDGDLTIALTNTNATQVARNYILNVTSSVSLTQTRNLIVPTISKPYIIENNTTGGQSIIVKTAAGSGVTVPNGKKAMVYANTTNVVRAFDSVGDLAFVNAAKITGDFSNATFANRVAFQSSTTNGDTALTALPNGTATGSAYQAYNNADPTNASLVSIQASNTLATLTSDKRGTGTYLPLTLATGGSARMYLDTSGNVGIATASPTALLDVNGSVAISATSARIKGDFSNATFSNRVAFQSSTTNGDTSVATLPNGTSTSSALQAYNNSDPTNAGLVSIQASNTLATVTSDKRGTGTYLPLTLATGGSARVYIDTSGNVGVGTVTPGALLDVNGNLNVSGSTTLGDASGDSVTINAATVSTPNNLNFDSGTFVIDATNNRVGVGTATPTSTLDVNGNVTVSASAARIRGDFSNATFNNRVSFQSTTTNGETVVGALPNGTATGSAFQAYNNATPTDASLVSIQASNTLATVASDRRGVGSYLPLAFATGGSARMYIDTSGNVGIATASPGSALDVKGTLRLSGATSGYVGLAPAATAGSTTYTLPSADGTTGQVLSTNGSGTLSWTTVASSGGTVTSVSVVSANGLAGTVANASTTPAITLSTTITGVLKGNGTAISAAVSGTDYAPATSGTSILYGNGSGGFSNVTVGTGLSFAGGTLSSTATSGPSIGLVRAIAVNCILP